MLTTIIAALAAEKVEGENHAAQLCARIDSHIRDLETLKAWIKDSARERFQSLDSIIGEEDRAEGVTLKAAE